MATDWDSRTAALEYFGKLVRQLKRTNDEDKEVYEAALHALRRSQDHTAIQNRLKVMREALEFYGDPANWRQTDHYSHPGQDFPAWRNPSECMNDKGERARLAMGKNEGVSK